MFDSKEEFNDEDLTGIFNNCESITVDLLSSDDILNVKNIFK